MNRKQFIILLVLVVVIGGAGLVVRQRGQTSWQSGGQAIGQKLLPNLAVNDIAQITIKSATGELNLAKRDNLWRVHERADYPANFTQISELLMKLADLKIAQSEDIGPSQLGRFELQAPGSGANAGTSVDLKDQSGKSLATLLLGKKHMSKSGDQGWPDGRYVMAGTASKSLAVISDPLDSVQAKPESWLNKEFLSVEKPRSIEVQFPQATNSWKLTRASETNDWQLVGAKAEEKLDPAKVSGVTSPLNSPPFNDVSTTESAGTNATAITIETFDGFTYSAKIGASAEGNYPVKFSIAAAIPSERVAGKDEKPEDKSRLDKEFKDNQSKLNEKLAREKQLTNWVFLVPTYSVDSFLKPRHELLAEPKKAESSSSAK